MTQEVSAAQAEVDALTVEFEAYLDRLRASWLGENRPRTRNVLEVMDEMERAQVYECIRRWGVYITPLAEVWWKERGYGVIWPKDLSGNMKFYKLKAA